VVSAVIVKHDLKGCYRSGRSASGHTIAVPYIEYQYKFNGISHTARRVYWDEERESCTDGEDGAWRKEFPVNRLLKAYVNPKSPDQSVLKPGMAPVGFWGWILVFIVTALGLYSAFYFCLVVLVILLRLFKSK
jgi:Protein of unknown function (DUF3592)